MLRIKRYARSVGAALLFSTTAVQLQGCVALVAGGAAVGTMSASDRRTLGSQTEDKAIVVKGEALPEVQSADAHVNVASFNRKVLLTGEVADETVKRQIARNVAAIVGVTSIVNELTVAGPSTYTSRSCDGLITSKVVGRFVTTKGLDLNLVKAVTERGNLYLMGLVSHAEGALAVDAARNVSGVQSVVKVFDYTD